MTTTTPTHAPYTLVLPAGWSRIPVGRGSRAAIRRILDAAAARSDDPGTVGVRRRLEEMLTAQVEEAARHQGVALYLPTAQVHGISVPASIVVSAPQLTTGGDPMDLLLAVAARRDGSEVLEIDGKPAVRNERTQAEPRLRDGFEGGELSTRQIVYYLADPQDDRRYLVITASVLEGTGEGAEEIADAVTELVDAMLTTFRWLPSPTTEAR